MSLILLRSSGSLFSFVISFSPRFLLFHDIAERLRTPSIFRPFHNYFRITKFTRLPYQTRVEENFKATKLQDVKM